jgi:dienelactone hydrolase
MLWMETRFDSLPSRLREVSTEIVIGDVPCLLVRGGTEPRPFLFWIHGRTADKELDPGRYLRYMRKGFNVCAVDLPGHGGRFEARLQESCNTLEVILQMASEIDVVLDGLAKVGGFDLGKAILGGMSAGGMAAIQRLTSAHSFLCAVLEATTGDYEPMRNKPLCMGLDDVAFHAVNPIEHLETWRNIPILAFHSRRDEWIPFSGQESFIHALQKKASHPELIEFVLFDHTGAPNEHVGFGRESAFVKELQVEFVSKSVQNEMETA